MKWFIASDLHGSAYYCEKMLEAYRREGADKILFLGDHLYHGPRNDLPKDYAPKKVIAMLNELKNEILAVRGNCDGEVDQMVLQFPMQADYAVLSAGKRLIYVTHGHVFNNNNLPPLQPGDILLHGHTHVPACEEFDTHVYMNPGSLAISRDGAPLGYMTFDGKTFQWKELDGTVYKEYSI